MFRWLEQQVSEAGQEKAQIENSIDVLTREKAAIERSRPSLRNMKKTLEFVFTNFSKAKPSEQRNFFREVFDKIVVFGQNQIRLVWRFAESGFGGEMFALEKEWGG